MKSAAPLLSIVVPVLNEADGLPAALGELQSWRQIAELILVDGGSADGSAALAEPHVDLLLPSEAGRARQMNAGAARARGRYLLFLHCDTRLTIKPESFAEKLRGEPAWGFFRVRLSGGHPFFRVIETAMNWRSRLTRVATGDQSLFVAADLWGQIGGFAELPLMEDVEISKRLRSLESPMIPGAPVVTSSRRWEQHGIIRTILLMWYLRLRYWLGTSPGRLAEIYRG